MLLNYDEKAEKWMDTSYVFVIVFVLSLIFPHSPLLGWCSQSLKLVPFPEGLTKRL